MTQSLLPYALDYAARGWKVFSLSGWKVPFKGTHGHLDATTGRDLIRAMWAKRPRANIGLALGELVVADADGPGGLAELQALAAPHGGLPLTLTARTSRGWHFYFLAPPGEPLRTYNAPRPTKGADGLDIKALGGFVVLPPSINAKTGFTYQWANEAPIASLPAFLVEWIKSKRSAPAEMAPSEPPKTLELGPRPQWLTRGRVSNGIDTAELMGFCAALKTIDASCSYDDWFEIGASIHDFDSAGAGLAIFEAWSKTSKNTKHLEEIAAGACARKWAEYAKPKPGKRLRTAASIYDKASRASEEPTSSPRASGVNGSHALPPGLTGVVGTPIHWVDLDEHKKPRPTCTNAGIAIEALGVSCRKDTFHEKMLVGGHAIQAWAGDLSDDAVHMLRKVIKRQYKFDPGEKNARDAAIQLCLENQFNPVVEYLARVQAGWDQRSRVASWVVTYLGTADTALNREIGRLMLVAAVRRARQPGCKFDQIIVLEGEEGTGKSSAIKILAGEDNFSDQHILGASDKEQQEAACGVWLHEIAELAGMRRTDVERTKQFASRTEDRARPAYGRLRVDMKRRGILIATTNEESYLKSETGNRRFWPIDTGQIDLEGLRRDRDQIWGEAAHQEASGTQLVLDPRLWETARNAQKDRLEADTWQEFVQFGVKNIQDCSIFEVLTGGQFQFGPDQINQTAQNRVARILLKMGWRHYRKRDAGRLTWRYRLEQLGTPGTGGTN